MIIPDINLLLSAYDTHCDFHAVSRNWWETCLSGKELVGLPFPVCFGFIRIATSSRIYHHPMTIEEAFSAIDSWISRPNTIIAEPGPHHVQIAHMLLKSSGSSGGNLVTDVQIAALAVEHKAAVHTADHDFKRFPKVKTVYPIG